MADLRLPATPVRAPAPLDPTRSQAARAAQAAFFQTALLNRDTPVVAAPLPPAVALPRATLPSTTPPAPDRILRPGSLLDIRI